jgi:putative transposase
MLGTSPDRLDAKERAFVRHLAGIAPDLVRAGELAIAFADLLRERRPVDDADTALSAWMKTARGSLIDGFVRGLERDKKAGLNRAILDPAPGSWVSLLTAQAAEAAGRVIWVDPRPYRPSHTDPVNGAVHKKALSERTHVLPEGRAIGRDQAAAWVLWTIGQRIWGED